MDMVGRGLPNKEIGYLMGLTEGTVKEYMFTLQRVTGLTRYQMIRAAGFEDGYQAGAADTQAPACMKDCIFGGAYVSTLPEPNSVPFEGEPQF